LLDQLPGHVVRSCVDRFVELVRDDVVDHFDIEFDDKNCIG
jgi:hypothetical protein